MLTITNIFVSDILSAPINSTNSALFLSATFSKMRVTTPPISDSDFGSVSNEWRQPDFEDASEERGITFSSESSQDNSCYLFSVHLFHVGIDNTY